MSEWRDRTITQAQERREELLRSIQGVLAEVDEVDGVLRALGVELAAVPGLPVSGLPATAEVSAPPTVPEEPQPEEPAEPPEPAAEEPEDPADLLTKNQPLERRVIDCLERSGPLSAKKLREELGVGSVGNTLFVLEGQKRVHRSERRERGTGQVQFEAGAQRPTAAVPPAESPPETSPPEATAPPATPSDPPKPKRKYSKKAGRRHPGPEALPEHLRHMPAGSGDTPVAARTRAAERELEVYKAVVAAGRILAVEVPPKVGGDRNDPYYGTLQARVSVNLRNLEEAGFIQRTGRKAWPSWQESLVGHRRGRQSVEYEVADANAAADADADASVETGEADVTADATAEAVRDFVTKQEGSFSTAFVAGAVEGDMDTVQGHLDALEHKGVIEDIAPMPDLHLYRYLPPDGPGAAAVIDMERRAQDPVAGGADPVPGTGKMWQPTHPEVRNLVGDLRRAGYEAAPAGSGHLAVTGPGIRRVLISGTPSKQRSVDNDRARLRRMGVSV